MQTFCRISMGLWTDSWLLQQLSPFKQSFFDHFHSVSHWEYTEWTRKAWECDYWKIEKNSFGWPCVFFFSSTLLHRKRLLWEQLSALLVQRSLVINFGFSLLNIRTPVLLFYSEMNWRSQSDSHNTEFGTEMMWLVIMSTFS